MEKKILLNDLQRCFNCFANFSCFQLNNDFRTISGRKLKAQNDILMKCALCYLGFQVITKAVEYFIIISFKKGDIKLRKVIPLEDPPQNVENNEIPLSELN